MPKSDGFEKSEPPLFYVTEKDDVTILRKFDIHRLISFYPASSDSKEKPLLVVEIPGRTRRSGVSGTGAAV